MSVSLAWVIYTPGRENLTFWESQLGRLRKLARSMDPRQMELNGWIPLELRGSAGKIKSAEIHQLLPNCSLCGDRWLLQLTFGFPTTWAFSQSGRPLQLRQNPISHFPRFGNHMLNALRKGRNHQGARTAKYFGLRRSNRCLMGGWSIRALSHLKGE